MEDVMDVIGERLKEREEIKKGKKETGEERRDEEESLRKEKELEKRKAVEEGRNYKEVAMEWRKKWDEEERQELEEKKEKESEKEYKTKGERETRVGNLMEVVTESQNEEGEVEGKLEKELKRELNLKEETILEVKGRGTRLRIKVEEKEDLEERAEVKKEEWEKVVRNMVVSTKRVDQWAGVIISGMDMREWKGKLGELRKEVEKTSRIKLMKEPGWLINEEKAERMKFRFVVVVCHVAKESERKELLAMGITIKGEWRKLRRLVTRREVQWCTKWARLEHVWW
ncbi:hypothetical protein HOY82DRAFT_542564 [Tuber indicum]|nr:hypothetical protein HOY82DRAFT_542564 [Tuber indicum]